jgi:hypothetical protein
MTQETKAADEHHLGGTCDSRGGCIRDSMGCDCVPTLRKDIDPPKILVEWCPLHAAAPELLAELEGIAETLEKLAPCPEDVLDQLAKRARQIARKARGL